MKPSFQMKNERRLNVSELNYLGGALEYFYNDEIENPHLTAANITVKENGKTIAHGTAKEIKDTLKDKYDRKIIKWDAYFHIVDLEIAKEI